jgi:hypothetical protein
MSLARSERFELPTLGFEVRLSPLLFNNLAVRCCAGVASSIQLFAEQSDLDVLRSALVGASILEQMSVCVERHLDGGVSHELLDALRIHPVFNPQGRAGVPQCMHAVLGQYHLR